MFGICALDRQNLFIKKELTDTETLFRLLRIARKGEGHLANDEFGRQSKEDKQKPRCPKFRNLMLYKSPTLTSEQQQLPTQMHNISSHNITQAQLSPKRIHGAMCLSGIVVFMLFFLKNSKQKKTNVTLLTMTTTVKGYYEKMLVFIAVATTTTSNGHLQRDGKHFFHYFNTVYVCLFICYSTYNNSCFVYFV
ncbi:hypothetical protein RFI_33914 [Reticulomyxa filosa]|uniref:Uncharacterized protein n=1 Tax=Reticulomyxa filosa TaxID=46433 RepID=X6LQS9_RETFI|nr:hypothetical protein RFI_33914 [Reticulomyxa filosa]|eukprot:ETO03492.1 hypothetical protein RFI_33914 [Reticulomyxa filosa]